MTDEQRMIFLNSLSDEHLRMLAYDWALWARDQQWPPPRHWRVWLMVAGRGFGKTRAGAEWVRMKAQSGQAGRIALVGETFHDTRQVMIEGASGILAISPYHERPQWMPSRRLLIWPSGALGFCYSAADPDQLRGPEHHAAWCDEIAKWPAPEAWDNLMLGLRMGSAPQVMATTTPKPKQWLFDLMAEDGVVLTQGKTEENKANLPPSFLQAVEQRFRQSGLAAQELDGEFIREDPNALWTRETLEQCRDQCPHRDDLTEVFIGVDPALGGGDETGIIVVGRHHDGLLWVLDDASIHAEPSRWASVIVTMARRWRVQKIIVEVNQGGALVEDVLRTKGVTWPILAVRARQGKVARAEPVAALYEAGRVAHRGAFARLEEEMCGLLAGGGYVGPGRSPDRADALVWALTELMLGRRGEARVRGL